jgi:hypothetical protein
VSEICQGPLSFPLLWLKFFLPHLRSVIHFSTKDFISVASRSLYNRSPLLCYSLWSEGLVLLHITRPPPPVSHSSELALCVRSSFWKVEARKGLFEMTRLERLLLSEFWSTLEKSLFYYITSTQFSATRSSPKSLRAH